MRTLIRSFLLTAVACSPALAQPPGITMDMINTTLPLAGAPQAVAGPYHTVRTFTHGSGRYIQFRPANLSTFPAEDKLPVVVWGNGGCNIDGNSYSGFLSTIASHGFLVLTTTAIEGEERRQQNADDILGAIDWAEQENARAGSPLQGKIDTSQVAVMGQSCGGFLSVSVAGDPRVKTIGVFNSGVSDGLPYASVSDLEEIHGPVMFINGHDADFMQEASHHNFELVNQVPAFYGARHDAGHTATMYHPGGGEFANVASNWLLLQFKGDEEAGRMFKGEDCGLCTNPNWETESKGL